MAEYTRNALFDAPIDPQFYRYQGTNALYGSPVTPDSRAGRLPGSYGQISNPAERPSDWAVSSGLAETLSPMVQGYGAGQMAGYARDALGSGDYGTATGAGLMSAMALFPMWGKKKGAAANIAGPVADMEAVAAGQGFGSKPKPSPGQAPPRPDGWPAWGDERPDYGMAFVRERDLDKQVQPLIESVQYPNGVKAMERFEAERKLMNDPSTAALLQEYHDARMDLHRHKQAAFADVKLKPGEQMHDPYATFNEPRPPGQALPTYDEMMGMVRGGLQDQYGLNQSAPRNALSGSPETAPAAAAERPAGFRAYHGSPHDFERFDASKIGTGEGAQAYGHGLYFAEQEATAKSYRDQLTGSGKRLNSVDTQAKSIFDANGGDVEKSVAAVDAMIAQAQKDGWTGAVPEMQQWQDRIKRGGFDGRMYEVNIKADPEHFLDWDKPIAEQHEKVRAAATPLAMSAFEKEVQRHNAIRARQNGLPMSLKDHLGGRDPSDVAATVMPQEFVRSQGASQALRDAGIPGIKYLDQGSRDAGEGSRNYVVFDPATVEIMRKYGLLGPMAGGVGMNALYGDQGQ